MALRTNITFGCRVVESTAFGPNPGQVNWSYLHSVIPLHEGTTPIADEVWVANVALVTGAATIALDALATTGLTSQDWTGKRVVFWAFRNNGAASMTLAEAAVNPYLILGGSSDVMTIKAGGYRQAYEPAGFGTVSGTVSDIAVAGTGTQDFDLLLIAGTV